MPINKSKNKMLLSKSKVTFNKSRAVTVNRSKYTVSYVILRPTNSQNMSRIYFSNIAANV